LHKRLVLGLTFGALAISASAQDAPFFSCESLPLYRRALATLDSATVDAASAKKWGPWVPDHCELSVDGNRLRIDHDELKSQLVSIAGQEDIEKVEEQLSVLHLDLKSRMQRIDAYARPIDSTAAPKLSAILARSEFRHIERSDPSATLKEKLLQLVILWLSRFLSDPSDALLVVKILTWGLGALALAILLLWLWRWLRRSSFVNEPTEREVMPFAPSAKPWRQWLAEARSAHEQGDFRNAIHLAYWAAVSKLEAAGKWPPDRARTPREYVALLPRNGSLRSVLQGITRGFEVAWYGYKPPDASESQQFLQTVERL
jgi:hypothetical protein